jgi:hypothetical protein
MHCHSRNEHKSSIKKVMYNIPENVAQQIIIWEEEKNAMTSELANFLCEFVDMKQFEKYVEVLNANKIPILWINKAQSMIVVPENKRVRAVLNTINNV